MSRAAERSSACIWLGEGLEGGAPRETGPRDKHPGKWRERTRADPERGEEARSRSCPSLLHASMPSRSVVSYTL